MRATTRSNKIRAKRRLGAIDLVCVSVQNVQKQEGIEQKGACIEDAILTGRAKRCGEIRLMCSGTRNNKGKAGQKLM